MLIIPAIDIKDGQCVRLRQGNIADSTIFSDDPIAVARRWRAEGARRLHLVDLDGAFAGRPINKSVISSITKTMPDLPIQIGGGVRDLETIASYFEIGVQFTIIGTMAARDPRFFALACAEYPGRIIAGIDARDGRVALDGWVHESRLSASEMAKRMAGMGASAVVYTDIKRDGMMRGANIAETANIAKASGLPVIASGGISHIDDIDLLMRHAKDGICGAILGRALYEGSLDLHSTQALVDACSGSV